MMKPIEVRLTGRFRFSSKIEGDHEGLLYKGTHMQTNQRLVMKGQEHKAPKNKKSSLSVLQEGKIYQSMQGGIGIPYMHWCGQEEDYNFIVLEELQCTLAEILSRCGGRFTPKTAMMIGIDLTSILQYFHSKNYIYNNISLRHIMLGKGQKYSTLHLIDLSKSSRYKDSHFQQHISQVPERLMEMRLANMQFSSFNFQKGSIPTRRDDMESLLHLIAFLIYGELPWSAQARNFKKTEFEKCKYIAELKMNTQSHLFKGYPELQSLLNYTKTLKLEDKPQYSYYISTFNSVLEKNDWLDDRMFDWMLLEEEVTPELTHKLDLYERQQELLQTLNNRAEPIKSQNVAVRSNSKIPSAALSLRKNDKECLIY